MHAMQAKQYFPLTAPSQLLAPVHCLAEHMCDIAVLSKCRTVQYKMHCTTRS